MPAKDGDNYTLKIGKTRFPVETVVSPAALQQGLSGRKSLPQGTGMLFIFATIKKQSMWMPDMEFPLDIVWLDENLSVVHITYGALPCVSRNDCPSYSSTYSAKYAIEMNSGDAQRYGFTTGAQLSL